MAISSGMVSVGFSTEAVPIDATAYSSTDDQQIGVGLAVPTPDLVPVSSSGHPVRRGEHRRT